MPTSEVTCLRRQVAQLQKDLNDAREQGGDSALAEVGAGSRTHKLIHPSQGHGKMRSTAHSDRHMMPPLYHLQEVEELSMALSRAERCTQAEAARHREAAAEVDRLQQQLEGLQQSGGSLVRLGQERSAQDW